MRVRVLLLRGVVVRVVRVQVRRVRAGRVVAVRGPFDAATATLCSSTGPMRAAPSSPATPNTSCNAASPNSHCFTIAVGFNAFMISANRSICFSETRSFLLSSSTSAHSTCSTSKSTTDLWREWSNRAMRNGLGSSSTGAAKSRPLGDRRRLRVGVQEGRTVDDRN